MKQKGFTLLELLLVLAVSGVLLGGAVLAIHQVVWGTDRSNSQVVALTDIDQASLAVKKDLMMTQSTDLTDVPQNSVTLTWTDYTTSFESQEATDHSSSYTLSGTDLQRNYDGTTTIIARNITYLGFTQTGRRVSVVITATGPGATQRSETIEFSAYIRAEALE